MHAWYVCNDACMYLDACICLSVRLCGWVYVFVLLAICVRVCKYLSGPILHTHVHVMCPPVNLILHYVCIRVRAHAHLHMG